MIECSSDDGKALGKLIPDAAGLKFVKKLPKARYKALLKKTNNYGASGQVFTCQFKTLSSVSPLITISSVWLCDPYEPRVNLCEKGQFCIIGKDNHQSCGFLNPKNCLLYDNAAYFQDSLPEHPFACRNSPTTTIGSQGLCHGSTNFTAARPDYMLNKDCHKAQLGSVTLNCNNQAVEHSGTLFVDQTLPPYSCNIRTSIVYVVDCRLNGKNMTEIGVVKPSTHVTSTSFTLDQRQLWRSNHPGIRLLRCTFDNLASSPDFRQKVAIEAFLYAFDSNKVKRSTIPKIQYIEIAQNGSDHRNNQLRDRTGKMSKLACSVSTGLGHYPVTYWEQTIPSKPRASTTSDSVWQLTALPNGTQTYKCHVRVYGKTLPPENEYVLLYETAVETESLNPSDIHILTPPVNTTAGAGSLWSAASQASAPILVLICAVIIGVAAVVAAIKLGLHLRNKRRVPDQLAVDPVRRKEPEEWRRRDMEDIGAAKEGKAALDKTKQPNRAERGRQM
jgi:hypothetical protein